MDTKEKHEYLGFIVKVLKLMHLWPIEGHPDHLKWREWRTYWIFISTMPTWIPLTLEIFFTFSEDDVDSVIQVQVIITNVCVWSMFYMTACFVNNRTKIKGLIDRISTFEKYMRLGTIEVDRKVMIYSKAFIFYSLVGLVVYCAGPWIDRKYCEEHRTKSMDKYGVPCITTVRYRFPFRYDVFPIQQLCLIQQFFCGILSVVIIVALTMLVCGILMHVISQLQNLRQCILNTCNINDNEELFAAMQYIVKYHIYIMEYFDEVNDAFGTILILHVTTISFVISVLCFEIIVMLQMGYVLSSIRFGLHLFGWLVILFFVCYYADKVIDESTGVAVDVYGTFWYSSPLNIQKDILFILLRSQKPLTLKAKSLGSVSAVTFLLILKSAYSYLTLLINFN